MPPSYSRDSNEAFTALRHHDEYYLSGGDLFFLIEQYHFRVHRYFFERESNYFKAQLATPASPGAPRQGTSESSAIVLDNIKAADFAKFLWVFYNPKYSLYKAPVDDWVKILDLAFRWGFHEVKSLVVRELEKLEMPVIDRIVVYHKYEIDRFLLTRRYTILVLRDDTLTLEESTALGLETSWRIFTARECIRAPRNATGVTGPTPLTIPDEELPQFIKEHFEIPEPFAPLPQEDPAPKVMDLPTPPSKNTSKDASKDSSKEDKEKEKPKDKTKDQEKPKKEKPKDKDGSKDQDAAKDTTVGNGDAKGTTTMVNGDASKALEPKSGTSGAPESSLQINGTKPEPTITTSSTGGSNAEVDPFTNTTNTTAQTPSSFTSRLTNLFTDPKHAEGDGSGGGNGATDPSKLPETPSSPHAPTPIGGKQKGGNKRK